jgi:putative transcriptional regulator
MKSIAGHFLIASPQLRDPNFAQTVTLIVQHDEDGSLGLIINRPTDATIRQAWEQVSDSPCNSDGVLHQGGPCSGPLMALHAEPGAAQVRVAPGVCFSAEPDSVETLVRDGAEPLKFFVGYAGWTAGQLEAELKSGSWLIAAASSEDVLGDTEGLWERLIAALTATAALAGLDPEDLPEDPSVN